MLKLYFTVVACQDRANCAVTQDKSEGSWYKGGLKEEDKLHTLLHTFVFIYLTLYVYFVCVKYWII